MSRRFLAVASLLAFLLAGCGSAAAPASVPVGGPTAPAPAPAATATLAGAATALPTATAAVAAAVASPSAPATPAATPVSSPAPAAVATPTAFPLTVTDAAGRKVTIQKQPDRIASLVPSATEIIFALGLGPKVVAVDQYSDYPPEAKQKPQLGSYLKPDLERLVAATPDLVLATGVHIKEIVPQLEARKLTVAVVDAQNLDQVLTSIGLVGTMTGAQAAAAKLTSDLRGRIDAVATRVSGAPRPRVYVELDATLFSVGPGSFVDDMVRRAGGQNIAADAQSQYPQLSQETIIQKDPQVILVTHDDQQGTIAAVRARPGWDKVSAVKDNRVVVLDPSLTNRPGPRVVDGLEAMAKALHPERFP